jgi:hypothetical protein
VVVSPAARAASSSRRCSGEDVGNIKWEISSIKYVVTLSSIDIV